MKPIIITLLATALLASCSDRPKESTTLPDLEVPTTRIFEESSDEGIIPKLTSSYSGRASVLQKLYKEALEADKRLQQLDAEIRSMPGAASDSLNSLREFRRNNNEYWRDVEGLLHTIDDSVLQQEMTAVYDRMEERFHNSLAELDSLESMIDTKQHRLMDLSALMRLTVTHKMMEKYQREEHPEIDRLRKTSARLDSVITRINSFLQES